MLLRESWRTFPYWEFTSEGKQFRCHKKYECLVKEPFLPPLFLYSNSQQTLSSHEVEFYRPLRLDGLEFSPDIQPTGGCGGTLMLFTLVNITIIVTTADPENNLLCLPSFLLWWKGALFVFPFSRLLLL